MEDNLGVSKKTICSLTNSVAKQLIHSNDLTAILQPQNYCGIILIDGKYVPVKKVEGKVNGLVPKSSKRRGKTKKGLAILPFMDYETHDIPIHEVAYSENMWDVEQGFRKLKEIGYPLKAVVCDESMGNIAQVAKNVFPDVVIQTCLTHYSKNIDKAFKVNSAKRKLNSLQNKLNKLGKSFFVPTHHYDIKRVINIVNEISEIEFDYGDLIEIQKVFQSIFWEVKTIEELNKAEDYLNEFIARINLDKCSYAKAIKARYLDYYQKRDIIIASILYPELKIPRTTNLIEGFNSTTLEIRFTSIRGFENEETAINYINAIILKRRFQKFKDCRGKFKKLNKFSPLEIAKPKNTFNYDFDSRDWINFCLNIKF